MTTGAMAPGSGYFGILDVLCSHSTVTSGVVGCEGCVWNVWKKDTGCLCEAKYPSRFFVLLPLHVSSRRVCWGRGGVAHDEQAKRTN